MSSQLIKLKDRVWFDRQKVAGRAVADCLYTFKTMIDGHVPNLSLKDIEAECAKIIDFHGCTPTFKGYKGFPGVICASVNKDIVHGIPTDYVLKDGDVVSIDLGATYEGAIADAALTLIYGKPKNPKHVRMLELCQGSLYKAIESIEIGKQLGCIGQTIYRHVRNSEFFLIEAYGGHGIDYNTPHAYPFVANKAKANEGIRIQKGLAIAIEPMLSMKSAKTRVGSDGWTISTKGISCHFEHSVVVWDDGVHIMTDWESLCAKEKE